MPRHPEPAATSRALPRTVYDALARRASAFPGRAIRLSVGDTWREPAAKARAESLATKDHPGLHAYASPQGEPALLDAILADLAARGSAVARELVQVVSGATVGLSVSCQALLDPGDEVLLLAPYWPLIPGIVASRGAIPVEVPFHSRLREPGFDLEACLEERVTARTAAIYLNTPNNPTGRVLDESEIRAVGRVAERHGLWILSDDVYEDLVLDGSRASSAWLLPETGARTVATHSVSKAYGMAGARVGWTHGPEPAMRAIRAVQLHQVYCAPRPMQVAASRALAGARSWTEETRGLYAEAARRTAAVFGQEVPEAGTFLFFDAAAIAGGADAMPFLERAADAGVLLTPGTACGPSYARWARLCFTVVPPDELDEALDRLRRIA